MQLFYGIIQGNNVLLDAEETRHATKVLRKKPGDELAVITGSGSLYYCQIAGIDRGLLTATIVRETPDFGVVPYHLHLAIAPTKNIDRFEWLLEKATEMGIYAITPLVCKNSERINLRPDRLQRILISAAKQSFKGRVPEVRPVTSFSDYLLEKKTGRLFIAHCYSTPKQAFTRLVDAQSPVHICIGPEGDFTLSEVEAATKAGFIAVHLGQSRLRTETAGLVAVSALYNATSADDK